MPNIIPYDDSPIVDEEALAEEHAILVDKLKQSLYVGQSGFIKAGQYLTEISDKGSYKTEDAAHMHTWKDFCSRPDLPLGGASDEGRVRTSQKLMTVWRTIASRPDVDEKVLAKIGYSKLALVASVLNNDPNANLGEWLARAEELTHADLQLEVGDGGMSLADAQDCQHEDYEEVARYKCNNCKKLMADEPGKPKKKDQKKTNAKKK